MSTCTAIALFAIIAVSSGFAFDDEHSADVAKERFARSPDQRQKFAFAFAKRSEDEPEAKQRFARDLENAKKFAFAFAKRGIDLSDEESALRFARDLDSNRRFAFAFAKRMADDGQLLRFARASFA
ncbi:unnamed protein product [Cylicocyclus nassatus]|uniref:Uncharacterized protein n=1 Tax=Cylicocyclus nassatus TaxID=53992 RepID=A0AA36H123_CYLNA|nr:unnamed protein product [Cylicocyclus nassatus]